MDFDDTIKGMKSKGKDVLTIHVFAICYKLYVSWKKRKAKTVLYKRGQLCHDEGKLLAFITPMMMVGVLQGSDMPTTL